MLVAGFVLAIVLIGRVSRIALQIGGFAGMAAGLLLAAWSQAVPLAPAVAVFGGFMLFNLAMNAGPNATTYLLSGKVFPTRVRTTGAGLAAACAKFGAVIGAFFFPVVGAKIGLPSLLVWLAFASLLAAAVTYAFRVETRAALDDGSPRERR